MTSTPPPPPGWPPPSRRGGGGLPGWAWAVLAVAAIAVVVVPVAVLLPLLRGVTSEPETELPTAGPAAPTATPPPEPQPTPSGEPDDDGGFLDGLLEDLLGGTDPATLAACIGAADGGRVPLPEDVDDAITVIADQVADDRGLTFTDPVDPVLLPPDRLRDRVVELSLEDYPVEAADADGRLLAALGAVPRGTDLRQLQLDLLGGQVAGFYDPRTGELTSMAAEGLDPTTRVTLAHELGHALVDQAIGLPDLEGFDQRSDEGLATLAVIEGDATLLMQRWAVQQLTFLEQLSTATAALGPADQLEQAPWVLQQQLVFPYTAGLDLVCRTFAEGGWEAVDALYADGPTTTASVLWPDQYPVDEPALDVPDAVLPDGWEEARRDQLGAAELLWLLQAPGDDRTSGFPDAQARARSWAGGELVLGTRGEDSLLVVHLVEHPRAPVGLCPTMTAWYELAFPGATRIHAEPTLFTDDQQVASVACDDDGVRLTIGPDLDAIGAIAGAGD